MSFKNSVRVTVMYVRVCSFGTWYCLKEREVDLFSVSRTVSPSSLDSSVPRVLGPPHTPCRRGKDRFVEGLRCSFL